MNCPYCNAILNNVLEDVVFNSELAPYPKNNKTGQCPYCKHYPSIHFVQIYYSSDNFVKSVMDLTLFKDVAKEDIQYRIECYPALDQVLIHQYFDKDKRLYKPVLSLTSCSITPKNAKDKLKLYLCLS